MCNVLRTHMDTGLQPGVAKSPLLNVQKILLSRKQCAATNAASSRSALFILKPRDQIVHNRTRDFIALGRVNVAEQHTPVRTETTNQMRPIEVLSAACGRRWFRRRFRSTNVKRMGRTAHQTICTGINQTRCAARTSVGKTANRTANRRAALLPHSRHLERGTSRNFCLSWFQPIGGADQSVPRRRSVSWACP